MLKISAENLFYTPISICIMKKPNIAIDGYSSTGKSSISKEISKRLNFIHLDTGALYRGITFYGLQHCKDENNQVDVLKLIQNLDKINLTFKKENNELHLFLNGRKVDDEIRSLEVSDNVSNIAKVPEIREFLLQTQQKIAENGGIVMDGRDIGTIVLPNAEYKFYLTASPDERARRRFIELTNSGITTDIESVKKNLLERDKIDSERSIAPLIQAKDAILIDNTDLNKEESIEKILSYITLP